MLVQAYEDGNSIVDNSSDLYKPGDVIEGTYEVHCRLGKGGFGIVYLVFHRQIKAAYALKTFRDEFLADSAARENFQREALLWVNLDVHPFIVAARFVEEFSGRLFVGMDYIAPDYRGCVSLEDYLTRSRVPLGFDKTSEWAIQFCRGMEHANSHGIEVHRDIKPSNILITQDGMLRIADFGLAGGVIAAFHEGGSVASVSADGRPACSLVRDENKGWCGTPGYVAPEVYEGKGADVRSDIYSFGAVLWQMTTGSLFPPFHVNLPRHAGEDDRAYVVRYAQAVYRHQTSKDLPKAETLLYIVIRRCLCQEAARRYSDFRQLRDELEEMYRDRTGRRVVVPLASEKGAPFWSNKGASLHALGRYHGAIRCCDKAIEINQRSAGAWTNKGGSLHALGRHHEAIRCCDKAIEIDPRSAGAWANKGISLRSLSQPQEAIRCYDKAIEIDSGDTSLWVNKGNCLNSLGRYQEAISCYDKAIQIDPRSAGAWTNKGSSLNSLGRYQEAIHCCDKALEVVPRSSVTWDTKGIGLCSLGRHEEAIHCYDKALEIDQRFANTWSNKGTSLHALGKLQEAIACYNEAIEIDERTTTWHNKAIAEEQIGNLRDAADSYRKFIELAPPQYASQHAHARERLRELEE